MQIFYDGDAELNTLDGKRIAVIGYGNQGRAQALNMRDSGVDVIVGNVQDAGFDQAVADGFPAMSIADAARAGDVLCVFLPDEVQQSVYRTDIEPNLSPGNALNFAHGYSIRYDLICPPKDVDVIMVAPRMIGVGVRERYIKGSGAPVFVAVEQDATGRAWDVTLAIAKAIGATRVGAIKSSFAEETELDHFMEQAVWPTIVGLFTTTFDLLTKRGFQPEAVLMELYASGESAQIMQEMADVGMFKQIDFHSHTSQYGTLSRSVDILPSSFRDRLSSALDYIQSGGFSREWEAERADGYPNFNRLKSAALDSDISQAEKNLRKAIK